MSKNTSDNIESILGLIYMIGYIFLGIVMPLYAIYQDIQHHKLFWAFINLIIFPIGTFRGLMYLFGG